MSNSLAVPAALSQILVALTIEMDNEFEHRMPHVTTEGRRRRVVTGEATSRAASGPWLTSFAMWANFLRFVPRQGRPLVELQAAAKATNLPGLLRWGYIEIDDGIVRLTADGRQAHEVWGPIEQEVVDRWRTRFREPVVSALFAALRNVPLDDGHRFPPYLPVVGQPMSTRQRVDGAWPLPDPWDTPDEVPLTALLSSYLVRWAVAFEGASPVSLAIAANHLRVLAGAPDGLPAIELAARTGSSKEATAMAASWLAARGYAAIEGKTGTDRGKVVRATPRGASVARDAGDSLAAQRAEWSASSRARTEALEDAVQPFVADRAVALFAGMRPYPDGWRARRPPPSALPHFPLVLHRGGFPDGS